MTKNWPTQKKDLKIASEIIHRHIKANNGNPLLAMYISVNGKDAVRFEQHEWLVELCLYYYNQYGLKEGKQIFDKVLTRILLQQETVH